MPSSTQWWQRVPTLALGSKRDVFLVMCDWHHRLESQLVLRWVSDSSKVPPQSLSEPSQQESQLRLLGRFASQRCLECPDSLAQQVNISLVNLLSRVHKPVCTCVSLGLSVSEGDVHILSYTGTHILTCSPRHFCPFVHSG